MFALTNLSGGHVHECQKYLAVNQQSTVVRRRYVLMRLIYTVRHDKDLWFLEKKKFHFSVAVVWFNLFFMFTPPHILDLTNVCKQVHTSGVWKHKVSLRYKLTQSEISSFETNKE